MMDLGQDPMQRGLFPHLGLMLAGCWLLSKIITIMYFYTASWEFVVISGCTIINTRRGYIQWSKMRRELVTDRTEFATIGSHQTAVLRWGGDWSRLLCCTWLIPRFWIVYKKGDWFVVLHLCGFPLIWIWAELHTVYMSQLTMRSAYRDYRLSYPLQKALTVNSFRHKRCVRTHRTWLFIYTYNYNHGTHND